MTSLLRAFLGIIAITVLSACGFTKSKDAAVAAVDTFHQQYNDSKVAEIYLATTPAFKSVANEVQFTKFIQTLQTKLGAVKTARVTSWKVNTINGATTVILGYDTDFEKGSGVETFTFVMNGESAVVQGYNVNSPKLNTNL